MGSRFLMRRASFVLALFTTTTLLGSQNAGAAIWTLDDHPFGQLASSSPYGIRVSSLDGTPGPLFSVGDLPGSSVQLSWDGGFAGSQAFITGTVIRNSDGTAFADTTWTVVYTLSNLTASGGGFRASDGSGSLTCTDCPGGSGMAINLELLGKAKAGSSPPDAFTFAPNGHRIPGDSTTWVGIGWLFDIDTITGMALDSYDSTNDWLVTAEMEPPNPNPGPLPEPSTLLLFAIAAIGLVGLTKRRAPQITRYTVQ